MRKGSFLRHRKRKVRSYFSLRYRRPNTSSIEGGAKKARGKTAQSTDFVTTDDEEGEVEGLVRPNGVSSQPAPASNQPRPRPTFKGARSVNDTDDTVSQLTQLTDDELTLEPEEPEPTMNGTLDTMQSQNDNSFDAGSSHTTPQSKKRARDATESGAEDEGDGAEADATQASEIVVRRKRVRH